MESNSEAWPQKAGWKSGKYNVAETPVTLRAHGNMESNSTIDVSFDVIKARCSFNLKKFGLGV